VAPSASSATSSRTDVPRRCFRRWRCGWRSWSCRYPTRCRSRSS